MDRSSGDIADPDLVESYTYWAGVAMEYFRGKEQQEAAPGVPQQQFNQ